MGSAADRFERKAAARDVDDLVQDLASDNYRVRRAAVSALAQIGGDRATRLIAGALSDPRKQVRSRAAHCLGRLGSRDSLGVLANALRDRTASVRKQAVEAIGAIGNVEDALAVLLPMLHDPDLNVVYAALEICGRFGDPRIVEPLLAVAGIQDAILQRLVILALAPMRELRTVLFLCGMLKRGARGVPPIASRALQELGDSTSLPRALLRANDLSPKYRIDALEALRAVRPRGWLSYIDRKQQLGYALPPVSEYCARMEVGDSDPEVRRGARQLIDHANLLRGSQSDRGGDVLLRAASGDAGRAEQDGLLIAASGDEPDAAGAAPSLWRRLFSRRH